MTNHTAATTTRYIVKRYRAGEAAPSLSLSYTAKDERAALAAHFDRYDRIGTATYEVCRPGERHGRVFAAREVTGRDRGLEREFGRRFGL